MQEKNKKNILFSKISGYRYDTVSMGREETGVVLFISHNTGRTCRRFNK